MAKTDWSKCPACGDADSFEVMEWGQIMASTDLHLNVCDKQLHSVRRKDIETVTISLQVCGYLATCCGEPLPDAYQDELDAKLSQSRLGLPR